jgi:hypothetical protein
VRPRGLALCVLSAFIASCAAFAVFGPLSALQQQRVSPIAEHSLVSAHSIDWARGIIVLILLGTILCVNLIGNAFFPGVLDAAPVLGAGLWMAILATALWRRPQWSVVPSAAKGAVFLVALVATASMMPVERLPLASWQTALGLSFLSAVFDNIPLTALALRQGGYDWGIVAFAVGFGGSMLWFGSSAGVALSNLYPEVRSVGAWVRLGWHVPIAYVSASSRCSECWAGDQTRATDQFAECASRRAPRSFDSHGSFAPTIKHGQRVSPGRQAEKFERHGTCRSGKSRRNRPTRVTARTRSSPAKHLRPLYRRGASAA